MAAELGGDAGVYCYIGRAGCCDHVVAVMVDKPEYKRHMVKEIGSWVRDGLAVERVTLSAFRAMRMERCACHDEPTLGKRMTVEPVEQLSLVPDPC